MFMFHQIERLCERISSSMLLEDRRDALRAIKSLSKVYHNHHHQYHYQHHPYYQHYPYYYHHHHHSIHHHHHHYQHHNPYYQPPPPPPPPPPVPSPPHLVWHTSTTKFLISISENSALVNMHIFMYTCNYYIPRYFKSVPHRFLL